MLVIHHELGSQRADLRLSPAGPGCTEVRGTFEVLRDWGEREVLSPAPCRSVLPLSFGLH